MVLKLFLTVAPLTAFNQGRGPHLHTKMKQVTGTDTDENIDGGMVHDEGKYLVR